MTGTSFLYPFLSDGEREAGPLLEALARSARDKADESVRLAEHALAANDAEIGRAAAAIVERTAAGGTILALGNGGSACDALAFVRLLSSRGGRGPRAHALSADPAILTALGNDVGTDRVFSRQVGAYGRPGDVVVAFSTSGQSANVLDALEAAHRDGMLTVAVVGYGGGSMTGNPTVDHCLVVESDSVHRVQEAQACLSAALCERILRGGSEVVAP